MRTSFWAVLVALAFLSTDVSVVAIAQDAESINSQWTWSASGKHNESDLARYPSLSGTEQLEIRFYKHEFGNTSILIPPREIKSHSKFLMTQMTKNKIPVTLTFDDTAPANETWAILEDPDNKDLLLTTGGNQTKLYERLLKSKQLTVSYPDKDGKPTIAVFDLSNMLAQVQAHNEKIHHFGLKDAMGGFTAF